MISNGRSSRWGLLAIIGALALSIGIVAGCGGESGQAGESEAGPYAAYNALREAAKEGIEKHQATFESGQGGEANRGAASTPAEEQVADRAYPRSYVDDRLARKESKAFSRIPAAKAASHPWKTLGPVTPNVSGPPSQFFDPATLTGPTTQESGRVTALAIDPACTGGDCRMWVAAAGGGIWRTNDALASHPTWIAPPNSLPTNAFGSLYYDAANDILYAGSGEPNGSGDSEAGLGLFKSTDSGAHWSLVPGSAAVATNRSIGAIAVDPSDTNTIWIGTDVARHGSSAVNGGRRTPPNAPALGVYRSTDGGANFSLETDLSTKTPANPTPASTGSDWFQGGVNKLEFDPNSPNTLYAAVQGYGVWRADQTGGSPTWEQVFHTMNQTDFSDPDNPGDFFGDRTEFDLVDLGSTTRMYVGDASDDWAIDGDAGTPLPQAWRHDDVGGVTGSASGTLDNPTAGYVQLSSDDPTKNGFAAYGWCQNGQCGYDSFVAHPPGAGAGTVWFGGSMNYDELKVYDQFGLGAPPRSNGRAVIRSTNAGAAVPDVNSTWGDMTAVLNEPVSDWGVKEGIHPDLHAIAFANNGDTAFVGSDGGVVRIDVSSTQDQSASCAQRTWNYDDSDPEATPVPLAADDLALCQQLLSAVPNAVTTVNDGLNDIQFQSLSVNPKQPRRQIQGGTQDNGTWTFDSTKPAASQWVESVGGDGGQSGFDAASPKIRYHNYYDATPEVNFHGANPNTYLDIYDPLQITGEARSFYTPFTADPQVAGRAFTGLESVWRTDVSSADEQGLIDNGCLSYSLDPFREAPCGDWQQLGGNLTSTAFKPSRAGEYVVAVERAPSDRGTLWAATRTGRLFITQNADDTPGSVSFRRLDRSSTPGRFISGIAVDPNDANHAWISYSGYDAYTPSTPGHVFEARYHPNTRRATFEDLSLDLGDQPVTGIAVYPNTGDVYAATDFGVLKLEHGSNHWAKAGGGLPKVAVYGLTLSQDGRSLYAATHGRGAYRLALPKR